MVAVFKSLHSEHRRLLSARLSMPSIGWAPNTQHQPRSTRHIWQHGTSTAQAQAASSSPRSQRRPASDRANITIISTNCVHYTNQSTLTSEGAVHSVAAIDNHQGGHVTPEICTQKVQHFCKTEILCRIIYFTDNTVSQCQLHACTRAAKATATAAHRFDGRDANCFIVNIACEQRLTCGSSYDNAARGQREPPKGNDLYKPRRAEI
ncbi:hypothetical protein IQ06DRAFT_311640 [Phaeosphaeriaceae sp. SRC1lsM3a]|nr:hypothetical protein IQ06DRAFT_311640 [Stagonospora sp. SRC1lsM3a]